jgi:hypothetical protein
MPELQADRRMFRIRLGFWALGTVLAALQAWFYRYWISADGVAYLDMSDAMVSGRGWKDLINGTWSPLYPAIYGLARRLRPDRYSEVVTGHLLNVFLFLAAFAAFEYLLCSIWPRRHESDSTANFALPRWACFCAGYAIFLWAAVEQISMKFLRADMLMAVFLFGAMGLLVRIQRDGPAWTRYLALGTVLGLGYLAKEAMLPIGMLILACSVFVTPARLRTLPKAIVGGVLLLVIGSAYFIPLSKERGHFTFGEASNYNYIRFIDQPVISAAKYITSPGAARGKFLHVPVRIFDIPPTYAVSTGRFSSNPVRFDPSYWTEGATGRFSAKGHFRAIMANLPFYIDIFTRTAGLTTVLVVLCFFCGWREAWKGFARSWPLWLIGLSGLVMYALVHAEDRYTAGFLALFWLGWLAGIRLPQGYLKTGALGVAAAVALSLLLPVIGDAAVQAFERRALTNGAAEVARQMKLQGVRAGDQVARISSSFTDFSWAHMAGVSIVAEVDEQGADDFWRVSPDDQEKILAAMSKAGAKFVVAHIQSPTVPPQWQRLGKTGQWIRRLDSE